MLMMVVDEDAVVDVSRTQRFIAKLMQNGVARSMEAESRDRVMDCDCGRTTSIWEMGGIRLKRSSE